MKLYPKSPLSLLCLIFTVITLFSCSKDSDLLADYVALDPEIGTIAKFVANDSYQVSISNNPEDDTFEITINSGSGSTDNSGSDSTDNSGSGGTEDSTSGGTAVNDTYQTSSDGSIILDVLSNDTFNNKEDVIIIENSQPENGNVVINNDNTLTYTPSSFETSENTFTYTAEFFTENGTIQTETATVTVEINPPSSLREGQVNFSEYGAVGDGTTDDTSALQAALDAESNLFANPGATFFISGTLYLDTQSGQTVDWNGATITTNTQDLRVFFIDKNAVNGGTTYMNDLLIDGNNKAGRGMEVSSRVEFTNIDGQDYSQTEGASSPAHIYARYDTNDADSYGDWIFDGCDADHLVGYGTWCDYCDGTGTANGYLVAWKVVPTSTTVITFKNATVTDGQGPDGQNVGVFSSGLNMSYTLGSTVFDNITTSGFDRRGWKIFCGNVTVKNCLIQDNLDSDGFNICGTVGQGPGYCSAQQTTGSQTLSSGLVAVGRGSGATGGDNIVFENVTFAGLLSGGTDSRIIPVNTTDMHFKNCTFTGGADLAFTRDIGDIYICGTDFGAGSTTSDFNEGSDTGQIRFGTNNTYVEGNFFSSLNDFSYIETDLTCQ